METCKYGSGADKRKPTAVKRKGVVYRAYQVRTKGNHADYSISEPYICTVEYVGGGMRLR